jgi:intein/homing endonuclease
MLNFTENFFKKHKAWLDRNREFLESSNWSTKPPITIIEVDETGEKKKPSLYTSNKNLIDRKEAAISSEKAIVKNIVGRLAHFIKNTPGEKHLKRNKEIVKYMLDIISIFTYNCDMYLEENPVTTKTITNSKVRNLEIKFQDLVFNEKIGIEDRLEGMGAFAEHEDVKIKFYRDDKASLVLREPLVLLNEDVKLITSSVDIKWETSVSTSKEMYINMNPKDIPPWNHRKHFFEQEPSTIQFWTEELSKIKNGVTIGGYFIHPWLYFHLNFFKTPIPQSDGTEPTVQPGLRDNEWFFAENLKSCMDEENENYYSKAMLVYGTRRFAKSVILASLAHWRTLTKFNSYGTIVGGDSSDLGSLTSKIKTSMTFIEKAFKLDMMVQNWDNGDTTFGIKQDVSNAIVFSTLIVQNLQAGAKTKTQKTAGLAPSVSIYDEIGKYPFLKGYLAALPSFKTPYGFKCVTVLAGCVMAGTKVWDNEGKLVNIENLKQEEGIIGYNGKTVDIQDITWIKPPSKKECVRIELEGGGILECSTDHPLLTSEPEERSNNVRQLYFRKAEELKKGSYLYKPEKVNIFPKIEVEDARLLGLLVGDGYYRKQVTLSIAEDEVFDYVKNKYKINVTKKFKQKNSVYYRQISILDFTKKLREYKMFGQVKEEKTIPDIIKNSNEKSITEFLAGYFDADGNIYYDKLKKMVSVILTSNYKHLLDDVSLLLLKLGIDSKIIKEKRNTKPNKGYEGQQAYIYRLYINKVRDVKLFESKIPILINKKKLNLSKVNNRDYKHSSGFLKKGKFNYNKKFKKGRFFKENNIKQLENLHQHRVKSVTNIGEQFVYNLTASSTHTYLSNGFISGNTGGEADLSVDAMHVLNNPEAYDLLPMNWDLLESKIDPEYITWKRRKFATFFPGQMAYEAGFIKENKPFGEFLGKKNEDLNKIDIDVTNWKKNKSLLDNTIAEAKAVKGSKGKLLAQQKKVQYPQDPEDCFITLEGNPFPSEEAKLHKQHLLETGDLGRKVLLSKGKDGTITADDASHLFLAEFPHPGGFIDAPVVLYEPLPTSPPPFGLYVAGFDDYKHDVSDGDSVGSMTIYKRQWFDPWSLRIVASYHSRPNPRSKFDRQCYYLLKAYNAMCFPENEDNNFKAYLDNKHETEIYFAKGMDFASELSLNNNGNRVYGWAATTKNIQFGYGLIARYLNEEQKVVDENGDTFEVLGVKRIPDIGMLEEIQNYTKEGNFDRLRSFMGALMYSHFLDKIFVYPKPHTKENTRRKEEAKKKVRKRVNPYRKARGNAYRK